MALKANINYKPDEEEVLRFFENQEKCGMVGDYRGYGILLHMEYPILTDSEIIKFLRAWRKEKSNK